MAPKRVPPGDKKYDLNMEDQCAFIAMSHCPMKRPEPDETWVWLLEVISIDRPPMGLPITRPVYKCRDTSRTETLVALYTPDPMADAERMKIKIGTTIVLKDALPRQFGDGRMGFRVENLDLIDVIPLPIASIDRIHKRLLSPPPQGTVRCTKCASPADAQCKRCLETYCSKTCQTNDWPSHKATCKTKRKLWEWNRTEFW